MRISFAPLFGLALIAAGPSEAAAKCVERIGHPVLPGYVYIVDGSVVGEYAMGEDPPLPPSGEILRLEVTCRPASTAQGGSAQQAAIVVITRDGAETLLTSYLQDLASAQREHRARTGAYAASAEELNFFGARTRVPLEIEIGERSWTAEATIEGSDIVCRAGSSSETPICRL